MHYGLDIGGTKIELAAFNKDFHRLYNERIPTPLTNYPDLLQALGQLIATADQITDSKGTVGLGIPGVLAQDDSVLISSNISTIYGKNLALDLASLINRPVVVENDANCFALAEATMGAGKDHSVVFGAILGTGIGGSLCMNKTIYSSKNRHSGEWGHIPLSAVLQQKYALPIVACGCGLTGCIDRYISGPGLSWIHKRLSSELLTAETIVEQYDSGNSAMTETINLYIELLASAVSTLVMTFDPDVIILGGGLSKAGFIYDRLPHALDAFVFKDTQLPLILPAELGDSSGVMGAAWLGSCR